MVEDVAAFNSRRRSAATKKTRIRSENEARILDAADEVFAQFGFHGATTDLVAEKADISKPRLHYYFRRKTDLYAAVLLRTLEIWLAPLAELNPDHDPAQELSRYIAEKVEMSRRYPVASRVFANEIVQGAPVLKKYLATELKDMVERKAAVISHWIAAGSLAPVDPTHLIFLIWAATQHYADFLPQVTAVMGVKKLSSADYAAVSRSLCAIILHGVLPPPASPATVAPARHLPTT